MLCVVLCCWLSCFSKSVTVSRVDPVAFKSLQGIEQNVLHKMCMYDYMQHRNYLYCTYWLCTGESSSCNLKVTTLVIVSVKSGNLKVTTSHPLPVTKLQAASPQTLKCH